MGGGSAPTFTVPMSDANILMLFSRHKKGNAAVSQREVRNYARKSLFSLGVIPLWEQRNIGVVLSPSLESLKFYMDATWSSLTQAGIQPLSYLNF